MYISASATHNSIFAMVDGLDPNYADTNRTCTWYINGSFAGTRRLGANVTSGGGITFGGLSPLTAYLIEVSITGPDWGYDVSDSTVVQTEAAPVEPWNWTISNGVATAQQTQSAYYAVRDKLTTDRFSYLVWNDMVDKVKEIADSKGFAWENKYATYTATKMTSGDRILTAKRFNSLRFNIGCHYPTGIQEVNQGDIIKADYFFTLASRMNEWINH